MASIHALRPVPTVRELQKDKARPTIVATGPLLLLLCRGSCAKIDTQKPTSDVNHESKATTICAITLGDKALHMLAMASIHALRPVPTVRELQKDKAKPTAAS